MEEKEETEKGRRGLKIKPFPKYVGLSREKKSGVLECPKEGQESYLQRVHCDQQRNTPLDDTIHIEAFRSTEY